MLKIAISILSVLMLTQCGQKKSNSKPLPKLTSKVCHVENEYCVYTKPGYSLSIEDCKGELLIACPANYNKACEEKEITIYIYNDSMCP